MVVVLVNTAIFVTGVVPLVDISAATRLHYPLRQVQEILTLRPHSIGMEIIYDKEKRKANGVRIIDENTNEVIEYYAKIIFLNASTLGSTGILLNSKSDVFPNGMGNSSDQLGRNLNGSSLSCWRRGQVRRI